MKVEVNAGAFGTAVRDAAAIAAQARNLSLSGVLVGFSPTHGLTLQAASNHVTFMRKIEASVDVDESDKGRWYLPASLASRLFTRLPSGSDVILEGDDSQISVRCGRTKAKLHLLLADQFPRLHHFDSDMVEVAGFAAQLKRIAFAAGKQGVLAGVLLDGKNMTATNQNMLASTKCEFPLDEPVVLPLVELERLLRGSDVVSMAPPLPGGSFVFGYGDTQITTTTLTDAYPKVDDYRQLVGKQCNAKVSFDPADMKIALDRMVAIGNEDDKVPFVRLKFEDSSIRLGIDVQGVGEIVDEIEAECSEPSKLVYTMSLPNLRAVLGAWGHQTFIMDYCSTSNLKVFAARDDDYLALWMPCRDPKAKQL